MGQRQAARGQVADLLVQRLDAGGQVEQGQLVRRRRAAGGVDHQHLAALRGQHRGQAFQHHLPAETTWGWPPPAAQAAAPRRTGGAGRWPGRRCTGGGA
jgi:hypothetical protein